MPASYPRLAGEPSAPIIGRAVVRDFGPAGVEVSAGFIRREPSDVELHNAWAASEGLDERLVEWRPPGGRSSGSVPSRSAETDRERSARRARQSVRWACKAIGVDRLVTLTYRANVRDLAASKVHFSAWARRVREHVPGFRYVAVSEFQERGAVHWHVALRGFVDVNLLRALWYRTLGVRIPREQLRCPPKLGEGSPGSVNIRPPRSRGRVRRVWAVDKLAGYIAKYVGKAMGEGSVVGRAYMVPKGVHAGYSTTRYFVRGEGRVGLAVAFFDLLNRCGPGAFVWQAADGMRLWGCVTGDPPAIREGPA